WNGGDITDGVGHRIINKRCGAVMKQAVIGAAAAGVNEIADGSLRNITELRRQDRVLVGPYQRDWIELPDVIVHSHIYFKAAQDIHVIVIHGEAAGDNVGVARGPVSRHGANRIRDRVVTENPAGGRLGVNLRTAYAVDVVGSALIHHAARHVVHVIVRICS